MPDQPRAGDEASCYCGRNIRFDGSSWAHTDDNSRHCYPDDPGHGEMRAEPDPDAGVIDHAD